MNSETISCILSNDDMSTVRKIGGGKKHTPGIYLKYPSSASSLEELSV